MAQTVVFMFFLTLPFDLLSIVLTHVLGMKYGNLHAKFHMNPSSINVWYAADTHIHTHTETHMEGQINSLANPFKDRLIMLEM